MMASTPCASSQSASSTVVAEESILAPQVRTRASKSGDAVLIEEIEMIIEAKE